MIFSSAARAESASCASLRCQSASWVNAAATCLGGAAGESQKWFSVISAPGKSFMSSAWMVGQQADAFEIGREPGKLLADFHNRFEWPV